MSLAMTAAIGEEVVSLVEVSSVLWLVTKSGSIIVLLSKVRSPSFSPSPHPRESLH
jgi:hypothetical protein